MKDLAGKIWGFVGAALILGYLYICLCVLPPNLVLDLFCPKYGQKELEMLEYNYGQMAGYPAGEGVTVLNGLGQYEGLTGSEYITFETDSITPIDYYRLKSATDKVVKARRRGSSSRQRPTYMTSNPLIDRSYYNRFYIVELPDGKPVAVWLEDAYYWKYKVTGHVRLPLGIKDRMSREEMEALEPYIQEYGLDEKELLVMFSEERYEEQKILCQLVQIGMFIIPMVILIGVSALVKAVRKKSKG